MSLDSVSRFTGTVDNYVKYRPNYPLALFEFLKSELNVAESVCELGSGTGIFTRQLVEHGVTPRVTAVEPNDSMRLAAEKESSHDPRIVYVKGTAEVSNQPSHAFDAVLGAQCFHWFDLRRALPEIHRIAKPNALCAAIWNDREAAGLNVDIEALLHRMSKPYATLRRPDQSIKDLKVLLPHGEEVQFDYHQEIDFEGLVGRMASTSYVMHGVDDKDTFNKELAKIFRKHERNGTVCIAYKTRAFLWKNIDQAHSTL